MRLAAALLLLLLLGTAYAGTLYEVTATSGTDKVKYRIKFGDAKAVHHWTAFDPKSKKFV